jgi:hypothetical protein
MPEQPTVGHEPHLVVGVLVDDGGDGGGGGGGGEGPGSWAWDNHKSTWMLNLTPTDDDDDDDLKQGSASAPWVPLEDVTNSAHKRRGKQPMCHVAATTSAAGVHDFDDEQFSYDMELAMQDSLALSVGRPAGSSRYKSRGAR